MGKNVWLDVSGDFAATANWSLGAAPVNGDDVYILAGVQNIVTNLNQSGVLLASLTVGMGFTGTIGSVSGNVHTALQIKTPKADIGVPQQSGVVGNGSGRLIFDFGSATAVAYNGLNTSTASLDTGFAPVRWKGTNAGNTANILGGRHGVGTVTGDLATVATIYVGGGALIAGAGVTWTTADVSGGGFTPYSTGTTLSVGSGAQAVCYGTGHFTTLNITGNAALFNRDTASGSSGLIYTTANVYSGGTLDLSGNPVSGSGTTTNLYQNGQVIRAATAPGNVGLGTLNLVNCGTLKAA